MNKNRQKVFSIKNKVLQLIPPLGSSELQKPLVSAVVRLGMTDRVDDSGLYRLSLHLAIFLGLR